jgi:hypothetical protein
MLAPPDACVATAPQGLVGIRGDSEGVDFRVMNDDWALPSRVNGVINLNVAGTKFSLGITDNTDTMVTAQIPGRDVLPLLDAMAKSPTMILVTGNEKPRTISLAGAAKVLNAFRVCARLDGGSGAGTNPFKN